MGDGVAGKVTPVLAFLTLLWEIILAYNKLEVVIEFFIAIIYFLINDSQYADVSATLWNFLRILSLFDAYLVF